MLPGEQEITWVLGTGRTGTSLLHEILGRLAPELICFQEPAPGPILNIYSKIRSEGRGHPLLDRIILYHLRSSREKLFARKAKKIVEINPFLFGLTDLLQNLFGRLRLIHMIRHPLTFVASSLNFTPPHFAGNFIHSSFWKLNASRTLGFPQCEWRKLSEAERWGWRWLAINRIILSAQNSKGGDYLLLRYEDLTGPLNGQRQETMNSIFHFLGIENFPKIEASFFHKKVNASDPFKKIITTDQKNKVLKICEPLMSAFNYNDSPE